MEKNIAVLDTAIRNRIFNDIMDYISAKYDTDALLVAGNEFSIPVVDDDGNEKFANVKVSIPRGTRKGKGKGYDPYDGYAARDEYAETLRINAEKEKEKEAKRKQREAEKETK